jgi:transcription elongation factor Elf1
MTLATIRTFAIFIARKHLSYDRMDRTVHCILCNLQAVMKPTKTNNLMLRCDNCKLLVFANSVDSEDRLSRLPDYYDIDSYDNYSSRY